MLRGCYEFPTSVKIEKKENASLLEKHDKYLFGKKFRKQIADTIKSLTKSPFYLAPHTHRENVTIKIFFLTKLDRKNFIIVTNSNKARSYLLWTDRELATDIW